MHEHAINGQQNEFDISNELKKINKNTAQNRPNILIWKRNEGLKTLLPSIDKPLQHEKIILHHKSESLFK